MYRTMMAGPGSPSSCIAAIILLLLAHTVLSISSEVEFSDGFPCTNSGIQLNRPFPRFVANGINDKCTLLLTSDKPEARAVSAFTNVASSDGYFWFQSRFRYKLSATGSADGIAAVFHQDPRAEFALGGIGGNLGVYGSSSQIIKNALVVEFDTRK
jgi:Bacterial lectin